MLAVTLLVSIVTLGTGRTHMMQGAVHLVLFAAFLFLPLFPNPAIVPDRPPEPPFSAAVDQGKSVVWIGFRVVGNTKGRDPSECCGFLATM